MDTNLFQTDLENFTDKIRVEVSNSNEDLTWEAFLTHTPGGSHLQSGKWGKIKNKLGWKPTRIICRNEEKILAGAQLLTKHFMPFVSVCYITRGPIIAPQQEYLTPFLLSKILCYSQEHKIIFLVIQPPTNGDVLIPSLLKLGFHRNELELAPTASILIDLSLDEDQLLGNMKRQTRQNIRRSTKEGMITRIGGKSDLANFYRLHILTSKRQNFLPYKESYFENLWYSFSPSNQICLVFSEYDQEVVSGLLLIAFGDVVCAKLLGWSGAYADKRPNDALFWAAIRWAKLQGYSLFDFEGVSRRGAMAFLECGDLPKSFHHTPDFLKYGFGGRVSLFPEAYTFFLSPVLRKTIKNLDLTVGGQSFTSKIVDLIRKR